MTRAGRGSILRGAPASESSLISPFPLLVSLAFSSLRYIGSPTLSRSPFVHGFPRPTGAGGTSELALRGFSVVRVFSSTRLPGFFGPESSATIRGSATPSPLPADGNTVGGSVFYGLQTAGVGDFPG